MYVFDLLSIEDLTKDTVYNIAYSLGCDIHYPDIEVNKYLYNSNLDSNFIHSDEFKEEQERCIKENKKRMNQFDEDIFNWLIDNNYLIEV